MIWFFNDIPSGTKMLNCLIAFNADKYWQCTLITEIWGIKHKNKARFLILLSMPSMEDQTYYKCICLYTDAYGPQHWYSPAMIKICLTMKEDLSFLVWPWHKPYCGNYRQKILCRQGLSLVLDSRSRSVLSNTLVSPLTIMKILAKKSDVGVQQCLANRNSPLAGSWQLVIVMDVIIALGNLITALDNYNQDCIPKLRRVEQ